MSQESPRPAPATRLVGAQELHGEVFDPGTGKVRPSFEPIPRADHQALPLEPGWLRVGIGRAAMDEHRFARSPSEGGEGKAPLALPDGWKLECVSLIDDWVRQLPSPTTVFFFANGDSFQGPVATP